MRGGEGEQNKIQTNDENMTDEMKNKRKLEKNELFSPIFNLSFSFIP